MQEILKGIKNIIYDLGEVIVDLDFHKTEEAFKSLFQLKDKEIYSYQKQSKIFDQLEVGAISPAEFRSALRKQFNVKTNDHEIDAAWNAMLLQIPSKKITLVQNLRTSYQSFVLSNTNEIHIQFLEQELLPEHGLKNLNELFDHVYYSHEIGYRKPHAEAYSYILEKHKLPASECLFIDDKLENIETAQALGIRTWHLQDRELLYNLL